MTAKFIEIKDRSNNIYLINVNHIVSVTTANDAILISFVKAGDTSTYGIYSKMTLEQFKALVSE